MQPWRAQLQDRPRLHQRDVMSRPTFVLVAATIAAATLALMAVDADALRYHHCSGGANPDGHAGDFYRGITAHRVSCPAARRAVRKFAYYHSDANGVPRVHSRKTAWRRWVCHSKFRRTADNGYENVRCRRGPGRHHIIRFYGAP
jgi:hypothetical protein